MTATAPDHIDDTQRRRDYFAAHAPTDIPAWFRTEHPPAPIFPKPADLSEKHRRQWEGLGEWLEPHEVDPEVIVFRDLYHEALKAKDAYDAACAAATFFAWRWHYADQMIAPGAAP